MKVATKIERPTDRSDELKASSRTVRLLDVPEHRFAMIDGTGPPAPAEFEARIPACMGWPTGCGSP